MRRFLLLVMLVVALVMLSLPELSAQEQGDGVLQVVETSPFVGEELGLRSEITLFFDRPIACETASDAVSIAPAVQGDLVCDEGDTALKFVPSEDYTRGVVYTVQVSSALMAQDGSQLLEPFQLELNTVGFLQVSEVFPSNGTIDIEADSVITVIFNRPVVPLVTVEDMGDLPDPLTIVPAVAGQGEWLNTSIYMFHPETALAGGVEYTVTVNAGLEAVDGSVLVEPYSWSFRTFPPEIISIQPEPQSDAVPLDSKIQVAFNQPMDRVSVEANFTLRPLADASDSVSGTFTWADDSTGFAFEPGELLQMDTLYSAGFAPGRVYEQTGTATLTGVFTW
ncbi:MAG: Ig-like domain-containing protein, partial [Anaerolineae bacterium]|nr:Ig-like domain-containing protein [Anaerolineae bacterium]